MRDPSVTFSLDPEAQPRHTIRGPASDLPALRVPASRLEGAYTVDRTLGTGGMAVVRLARQHALERDVAIKAPLGTSVDAVSRVLQEAWVTGALEHPGVVPVHDVAVDAAGCPHIVMRRIEGWTWTELLAAPEVVAAHFGARDEQAWHLRVWMSVAATVHHAHLRGVVHRDLKPDNVMVGPSGEAYVLDWGLAAALDDRAAHYLPRASALFGLAGTPRFMAPEVVAGEPQGVHTDVYLLGGLLHAILTGDGPHLGEDTNQVLAGILDFVPAYPDAPARLAALAAAALARDPADRPASAEALRRSVLGWLEERDADALVDAGARELAAFSDARVLAVRGEEVYGHFAAAKANFEQALLRFSGHEAAKSGLARLGEELVRWELDSGHVSDAERALAVLTSPPAELTEAVLRARKQEDFKAAEARALLAEHDPSVGIRTRAFVIGLLGLVFTLTPMYALFWAPKADLWEIAAASAGTLAAALLLWVWARESLSRTALNRAVIRSVVAALVIQLGLVATAMVLDMPSSEVLALFPLVWAGLSTGLAIAFEPVFALVSLGFFGAFLVTYVAPEQVWVAYVASNAWLFAVSLARWGPEAVRLWVGQRWGPPSR